MSSNKGPAPDVVEIEQAKRNAAAAKARVQGTAGALKQRLHPRTLAADAAGTVKERTNVIGEQARQRPGAASAIAGVATLILFRKPLGKLAKRLFSRKGKDARRARRDERRARKEAARLDKEEKRLVKERRRTDKATAKMAARRPEVTASPSDDLIPHAAAVDSSAAAAKQE